MTFTVGAPEVQIDRAESMGATTVAVFGVLVTEPHVPTRYWAEYALLTAGSPAESRWCASGGAEGSAQATPLTAQEFDAAIVGVSVDISGLTAGEEYCMHLAGAVARAAHSESLFLAAGSPLARINALESRGPSAVTIDLSTGITGQEIAWLIEYGLASSEWCQSHGRSGVAEEHTEAKGYTGSSGDSFELTAGLRPGIEYCAAAAARNTVGATRVFEQKRFTAGLPTVRTTYVFPAEVTAVRLYTQINAAGQPTEYWVEYALGNSEWCKSSGHTGGPEHVTPPSPVRFPEGYPVNGTRDYAVTELTDLSPNTAYCVQALAANRSGVAQGEQTPFRTSPEPTLTVIRAGPGSGRVSGSGIACPTTCSAVYPPGTQVTLTATPDPGDTFTGWSGPCTGTGVCHVTVHASERVTATFAVITAPPSCMLATTRKANVKVIRSTTKGKQAIATVGKIAIAFKCNQATTAKLGGVLNARLGRGRIKHFTLTPVRATVKAGEAKTLMLQIPAAALRDLERNATERATVALTATNGNGKRRTTAVLAVRIP